MTSWKNRVTAAIATAAIAASMLPVSALAAGSDLNLDSSITVSGLVEGDTVQYYQIIEQDATTGAWKFTEAVDKPVKPEGEDVEKQDGIVDGSTYKLEDIVITDKTEQGTERITPAMANAITVALTTNNATPVASTTAGEGGSAVLSAIGGEALPAGLYMVVASPGATNKDTIYKPIFVSADYYESDADKDTTDSRNVSVEAQNKYYQDDGVFKKSTLSLTKESGEYDTDGKLVDAQRDVSVGDEVSFTIKAPMPTFTKNYESPIFTISDELTSGLELNQDSIQVVLMDSTGTTPLSTQPTKGTAADGAGDYIVTSADKQHFSVAFQNDLDRSADADGDGKKDNDKDGYLYTVIGNPVVVITYEATVLDAAATEQVNEEDNTAKLNFSNAPSDKEGKGELKDKTRHYIFDIDANVFGGGSQGSNGKTSEIRKVRMEANGTIVEEKTTSEFNTDGSAPEGMNWLADAEFKLTMVSEFKQNEANPDGTMVQLDSPVEIKFKDGMKSADADAKGPKSDANGYIPMKGLDAGVYTLEETKAPAGYAFTPKAYTITITPTYVDDADGNDVLQKYVVKIDFKGDDNKDHSNSSTYWAGVDNDSKPIELTNDDASVTTTNPATSEVEQNVTTLIVNKKLGILPSTGGSGIYFYLVLGGAIAGVSAYYIRKTKKQEELLAL